MPTHFPPAHSRSLARPAALLPALLALGVLGCGSGRVVSKTPDATPPEVLSTQPVARSTGVIYDTPITVDFAADMDVTTLTTQNVFLKLDTQRVPLNLSWDAPA